MSADARADALEKASIDAAVEGLKALLLLNGGACIALLAFLSATIGKEHPIAKEAAFVDGAVKALGFFSLGAGLAVITCVFAYLANQAYSANARDSVKYPCHWTLGMIFNWLGLLSTSVSLGMFFWGVYTIWSKAG